MEAETTTTTQSAASKDARLAEIGWPQYQAAQCRVYNARARYDRASAYGYPAKEADELRAAEADLERARQTYPLSALYARAESWSLSSHYVKAAAGARAMRRIEDGEDPDTVVAEMEQSWRQYCFDSASSI